MDMFFTELSSFNAPDALIQCQLCDVSAFRQWKSSMPCSHRTNSNFLLFLPLFPSSTQLIHDSNGKLISLYLLALYISRCRPDFTTTGRREDTSALVTVVSASTEPTPVDVVTLVVNTITASLWISSTLVISVKSV
jgi:hypothetical protein